MIVGIGVDIIEIERIQQAIENNGEFLNKYFTSGEVEYFIERKMKPQHIAGGFAAKEAISKALGTGFRGIGLKDIEVLRDEFGKPYVNYTEKLKSVLQGYGQAAIHISISHNRNDAVAYAILEKLV